MHKVLKKHLDDINWQGIYDALDRDPKLICSFIRSARKAKRIPAADLDTLIRDISVHVKNHIELTPSGIDFH